MRITKISVKGLFGMFDHEIPLNQDSRITIVHGPNGVGKTVLMRMVHSLFSGAGEIFGSTPFELFEVYFEDGIMLGIEKTAPDRTLIIQCKDTSESELEPLVVNSPEPFALPIPDHYFWNWIPPDWGPEWLQENRSKKNTVFVHTLRLQEDLFDRYGLPTIDVDDYYDDASEPVVKRFQRHFWDNISAHEVMVHQLEVWQRLAESFEAEASFVTDEDTPPHLLDEHLEERWLKGRQKQLQELRQEIVGGAGEFTTAAALLLFLDIANERFLFKSLIIKDGTISVSAVDGSDVPLSALSSGEQQLLVLYYQLLFEIEPDTLVMIDEPELSMNVVWQRNFLKDLQRIIELRKFDVLIATHSPQIIHDKWDWVVHLGEKVDD